MTALLKTFFEISINEEIQEHSAWKGTISGLKAEKMLRGKKTPYMYLIRGGEQERGNESDYYLTFVRPDLTIHHQPFVITINPEGWYYENFLGGGPYLNESIDHVIHLIMHCNKDEAVPFIS